MNWTRWNKRDKVWSSATSLVEWRFRNRSRCRCCCFKFPIHWKKKLGQREFNRLIWQQNGNVISRRESARIGLISTSGAQFAAQPLVKPVVWFARAVINWRSRLVAKSAYWGRRNCSYFKYPAWRRPFPSFRFLNYSQEVYHILIINDNNNNSNNNDDN